MFLDYSCPYSAKAFLNFFAPQEDVQSIWSKIKKDYPGVRFVFRHQVQPWHPQSTMLHEAALAVAQVSPSKFFQFSKTLFEHCADFYDVNTYTKSRLEIYKELAALAPVDILPLLLRDDSDPSVQNGGNAVTDDFKRCLKLARQNSIHVTPTMSWNGVVEPSYSSSWTLNDWTEFLARNFIEQKDDETSGQGIKLSNDSVWDSNEVYDSILPGPHPTQTPILE
jgi:protein-disulfide isomerase